MHPPRSNLVSNHLIALAPHCSAAVSTLGEVAPEIKACGTDPWSIASLCRPGGDVFVRAVQARNAGESFVFVVGTLRSAGERDCWPVVRWHNGGEDVVLMIVRRRNDLGTRSPRLRRAAKASIAVVVVFRAFAQAREEPFRHNFAELLLRVEPILFVRAA